MKLKVFIVILALRSVSGWAEEVPNGPHLITSGSAHVEAMPDMAILTFQVTASAKASVAAKAQVDQRVSNYVDFLKQQGIEGKAIQMVNLVTEPEYSYLTDGKTKRVGYNAQRTVQVTLHQLDKLNHLLDAALKANLNEVHNIELGVAKSEVYREQARQEAIKNAIKQASEVAKGFGVPLGAVYSIRYHASPGGSPMPRSRLTMTQNNGALTSASQTYQSQSIYFDDQVEVVFRLGQQAMHP